MPKPESKVSRSFAPRDLLNKIEWEGGVLGAIEYGINNREVPPEVGEEWEELESLLVEIAALEASIISKLESSAGDLQAEDWEDDFEEDAEPQLDWIRESQIG